MDKRALIGIALSVLVLVAYQEFISRYYGPPPINQAPVAEKKEIAAPSGSPAQTAIVPAAPNAVTPQAAPTGAPNGQPARDIRVETDNYIALFTTQGARLKSFQFKNYRASAEPKSPPYEIVATAKDVPLPLGVRWQAPAPFDDAGMPHSPWPWCAPGPALVPTVVGASLALLAILGGVAAQVGGAPLLRGTSRVLFWGALAMAITAAAGALFGAAA